MEKFMRCRVKGPDANTRKLGNIKRIPIPCSNGHSMK